MSGILDINNIKRVNSNISTDIFIDEYRFSVQVTGNEKVLRIKDLEAARYGMFSRNQDIGGTGIQDTKDIADFIKKLMDKVAEIKVKMINEFDTKFGIKC